MGSDLVKAADPSAQVYQSLEFCMNVRDEAQTRIDWD